MNPLYVNKQNRIDMGGAARAVAKEVGEVLGKKHASYCVGYHVRNVLDRNAPTVEIAVSSPSDARRANTIKYRNAQLGLHTINHVLDSLCYSPTPRLRPSNSNTLALLLRLTCAMKKAESCHYFDAEERTPGSNSDTVKNRCFEVWRSEQRASYCVERAQVEGVLGKHAKRYYERMGVFVPPRLPIPDITAVKDARQAFVRMFGDPSAFYNHYACGTQKLCDTMNIPPSLVAYRAIMAAIYQLRTYALPDRQRGGTRWFGFGRETLTFLLRSPHCFATVVGVTLITKKPVKGDTLLKVLGTVASHKEALDKEPPSNVYKAATQRTGGMPLPNTFVRNSIVEEMRKPLCSGDPFPDAVGCTISSFLKQCSRYCDEKLEGRHLRFGFLLGASGLLRFWPGPRPLGLYKHGGNGPPPLAPLEVNPRSVVHLIEGPEDRSIVIPYCGDELVNDAFPNEVLALEDCEEALMTWSSGMLWSHAYRPYVFLTQVFPWAVGVVVGPGSHMRVVHGGRLVGFRDGKGWRVYKNPLEDPTVKDWLDRVATHDHRFRTLLRSVTETALQTSPMVREDAHGGFFVYWPGEVGAGDEICNAVKVVAHQVREKLKSGKRSKDHEADIAIEPVRDYEPPLAEERDRPWLTGRALVRSTASSPSNRSKREWEIDPDVGNLLVRASMQDGAVILCGVDGTVRKFSQQVVCTYPGAEGSGTKAKTAKAYVRCLSHLATMQRAFAVKVSSDGPVTLYIPAERHGHHDEVDLFCQEV